MVICVTDALLRHNISSKYSQVMSSWQGLIAQCSGFEWYLWSCWLRYKAAIGVLGESFIGLAFQGDHDILPDLQVNEPSRQRQRLREGWIGEHQSKEKLHTQHTVSLLVSRVMYKIPGPLVGASLHADMQDGSKLPLSSRCMTPRQCAHGEFSRGELLMFTVIRGAELCKVRELLL